MANSIPVTLLGSGLGPGTAPDPGTGNLMVSFDLKAGTKAPAPTPNPPLQAARPAPDGGPTAAGFGAPPMPHHISIEAHTPQNVSVTYMPLPPSTTP